MKKICVIGGGNIGSYIAVYAKMKKFYTSLYVNDKARFSKTLSAKNSDSDETYTVELDCITSDLSIATENADVVFVTYPSFMFSNFAEQIVPYINKKTSICLMPGTGGAEFAFENCIKKGVKFFGLQRVPLVARLVKYGEIVNISGKRKELFLGSIGATETEKKEFCNFLEELFEMKCSLLPNYLSVTLTPSNSILHTSRLCSMFKDYRQNVFYKRNILFYEEWDDEASELLLACDSELQNLCFRIKEFDLSSVASLKKHYESDTKEKLTRKIKSIKSFKGLLSPMKNEGNGWIPDFSSRYFSADFPFGLKILIESAKLFDVKTPSMDLIWNWFASICPDSAEKSFELKFKDRKEFIEFYSRATLKARMR